ncbi:SSI family serine proteinase inhibitor [Streptomyces griseorubiginosus]|uniref:Subtilisin inhibitor n=1 Tax=Streptomyces griseorubiginosus TaxID=67304 RepID=A0AAI8KXY5_9ACTN|nr:SSI family serine proteinase inhibitor [Streptomyces griseorubiginosus]AYC37783.1 Subtilisin inhibitor [Streptomyces griseorubiginosus]
MTHTHTATALRRAARTGLTAAAVLLAAAAPVSAGDRSGGDYLYLTVTKGDSRSSDTRGTLLLCDPPQGHGRAAEACAQLDAADGDIGALPAADVLCPMLYAPVTVQARGQWNGRPVEYRQSFSNTCLMEARTGAVFALES